MEESQLDHPPLLSRMLSPPPTVGPPKLLQQMSTPPPKKRKNESLEELNKSWNLFERGNLLVSKRLCMSLKNWTSGQGLPMRRDQGHLNCTFQKSTRPSPIRGVTDRSPERPPPLWECLTSPSSPTSEPKMKLRTYLKKCPEENLKKMINIETASEKELGKTRCHGSTPHPTSYIATAASKPAKPCISSVKTSQESSPSYKSQTTSQKEYLLPNGTDYSSVGEVWFQTDSNSVWTKPKPSFWFPVWEILAQTKRFGFRFQPFQFSQMVSNSV